MAAQNSERPGFVNVDPDKLIPDARRGYTKTQLKDIAAQLGLRVGGNKADLVGRIKFNLGIPIGQRIKPIISERLFVPSVRPVRSANKSTLSAKKSMSTVTPLVQFPILTRDKQVVPLPKQTSSPVPFSPTAPFTSVTTTQSTTPERNVSTLPAPSTIDPRIGYVKKMKADLIAALHAMSMDIIEKKIKLPSLYKDINKRYGVNAKSSRIYRDTLDYDKELTEREKQIIITIRELENINPTNISKYDDYIIEFRLAKLLIR